MLHHKQSLTKLKQEEVVPIYDLFGRFKEWEKIPKLFRDIAQRQIKAQEVEMGKWTGRIKLSIDGKRLGYKDNDTNTLFVTSQPSGEGPKEPVFTVLSGIMRATDKTLKDVGFNLLHWIPSPREQTLTLSSFPWTIRLS